MNALLMLLAVSALGAAADPQTVVEPVLAVAQQTATRMETEGAAWTVRHDLPRGYAAEVVVEQYPQVSRLELRLITADNAQSAVTVFIRDGVWYVDSGHSRGRYRPYEAPMPVPSAVHFFANSKLPLLTKERLAGTALVSAETEGDRLVLRTRGTEAQRERLQGMIAQARQITARYSAARKNLPPELDRQVDELKAMLATGVETKIDPQTGIIVDQGLVPKLMHCRRFAWKGKGKEPAWDLNPQRWPDYTQPFSAEEMKDVVQMGHNPLWRPGSPAGDSELVLMNVRTGRTKRVPFPFGVALSGCFSADRTRLYVPGAIPEEGSITLFEVNLTTGQTTPLGDDAMRRGSWLGPSLAPNGRYLAAAHVVRAGGMHTQIQIIDLKSAKTRAIGEPMDMGIPFWHPDGRSLFCSLRETDAKSKTSKSFLVQITFDGKTRKLCEGEFPCLLPPGERIVFENKAERQLKTCNLAGADIQLLGDGFKGFGFPAPSADGRMLLMRFIDGKSPEPCLVDLKTFAVKPLVVGAGLWSRPVWQ